MNGIYTSKFLERQDGYYCTYCDTKGHTLNSCMSTSNPSASNRRTLFIKWFTNELKEATQALTRRKKIKSIENIFYHLSSLRGRMFMKQHQSFEKAIRNKLVEMIFKNHLSHFNMYAQKIFRRTFNDCDKHYPKGFFYECKECKKNMSLKVDAIMIRMEKKKNFDVSFITGSVKQFLGCQ